MYHFFEVLGCYPLLRERERERERERVVYLLLEDLRMSSTENWFSLK